MAERAHRTGAASPRRVSAIVIAFAVIGAGTWLYKRPPAVDAPVAGSQPPASQTASGAASALAAATVPGFATSAAPAPAVPAPAARASAPQKPRNSMDLQALAQLRSPAEALRKVQLALGDGTPQELLEAAETLQACTTAARTVSELHALRDRPDEASEHDKKLLRDMSGVTNEMIEFAQIEARRCQVFDSAMMGRRRELFQRAYDGGAEGSAAAYLGMLQKPEEKGSADPALVARLQADVRQAAAGGDSGALLYLVMAADDRARGLGVTAAQRAGYRAAWKHIEAARSSSMAEIFERFMSPAAPLSAAEQAEANALTQQVLEAWRLKHKGGQGG